MSESPMPFKVDAKLEVTSKHLAKPFLKFLEAVRAGCGVIYEPTHLRRMARARADVKLITAQATAEAASLHAHAQMAGAENLSVEERAEIRFKEQNTRRQRNIDATVMKALEYLPANVSDEPVSPDLMSRIFEGCQDVSEPEMQTYWSKLMVGEVAKPGAFSRRAINLLAQMGKEDGRLFEKANSLFWFHESAPTGAFIPSFILRHVLPNLLNWDEAITLDNMGLLHTGALLHVDFPVGSILRYGLHRFRIGEMKGGVTAHTVTAAAQELSRLCIFVENRDYFEKSKAHLNGYFSLNPIGEAVERG